MLFLWESQKAPERDEGAVFLVLKEVLNPGLYTTGICSCAGKQSSISQEFMARSEQTTQRGTKARSGAGKVLGGKVTEDPLHRASYGQVFVRRGERGTSQALPSNEEEMRSLQNLLTQGTRL